MQSLGTLDRVFGSSRDFPNPQDYPGVIVRAMDAPYQIANWVASGGEPGGAAVANWYPLSPCYSGTFAGLMALNTNFIREGAWARVTDVGGAINPAGSTYNTFGSRWDLVAGIWRPRPETLLFEYLGSVGTPAATMSAAIANNTFTAFTLPGGDPVMVATLYAQLGRSMRLQLTIRRTSGTDNNAALNPQIRLGGVAIAQLNWTSGNANAEGNSETECWVTGASTMTASGVQLVGVQNTAVTTDGTITNLNSAAQTFQIGVYNNTGGSITNTWNLLKARAYLIR